MVGKAHPESQVEWVCAATPHELKQTVSIVSLRCQLPWLITSETGFFAPSILSRSERSARVKFQVFLPRASRHATSNPLGKSNPAVAAVALRKVAAQRTTFGVHPTWLANPAPSVPPLLSRPTNSPSSCDIRHCPTKSASLTPAPDPTSSHLFFRLPDFAVSNLVCLPVSKIVQVEAHQCDEVVCAIPVSLGQGTQILIVVIMDCEATPSTHVGARNSEIETQRRVHRVPVSTDPPGQPQTFVSGTVNGHPS